jgi:inhibitor of cysteine peptidase
MLHPIAIMVGWIAIIGLLNACGAEPSSAAPTTRLTEADAGRSIELRVGNILEVTLPGNPTTGFQWEVGAGDSTILKLSGEPVFEPSSGALGGGGQSTLRFQAIAAGQTPLKLIYHRPFEKDTPPAQTFEVTVTVK